MDNRVVALGLILARLDRSKKRYLLGACTDEEKKLRDLAWRQLQLWWMTREGVPVDKDQVNQNVSWNHSHVFHTELCPCLYMEPFPCLFYI